MSADYWNAASINAPPISTREKRLFMTTLIDRISHVLDQEITGLRSLSGGCVGEVYAAQQQDGTQVVAKVDAGKNPRLSIEAQMLTYLGTHTSLTVPRVLHGEDSLLIMTFLENDGRPGKDAEIEAADALAKLHDITAESYGFTNDTLIGGLTLPNPQSSNWPEFFADHRLRDMARRSLEAGQLDAHTFDRIDALASDIHDLIEVPRPPSLIHGDVWSGNVLFHQGHLAGFIDPAIYFADPEIELAFISLFHTFGDRFYARYQEHHPISPGFFELRKDLYNLFPLLVHARLFGGTYVRSIQTTLRQLGY